VTRPAGTAQPGHPDEAQLLPGARPTLAASVLGFFMITLDAVIVNVVLPRIQGELGGGVAGLQWVVAGYTLMFAALLLSAGALSDRIGARRAFAWGMGTFVASSAACGLAPSLGLLVEARFVQGASAAVMMPSSMALIREAYPAALRGRAVATWAMGAALAASSGPVLGGLLSLVSWRLIFYVNVPVGAAALLLLLGRARRSEPRSVPFDWLGQDTAVAGIGALIFGAIETGEGGVWAPRVLIAFAVGILALAGFLLVEARVANPMLPLELVRSRVVAVALATGFAFMVGYFGLAFVMTLYLQQVRGLTTLETGLAFLPMMLTGPLLTPFIARLMTRFGARTLISGGLLVMTTGLAALAMTPVSTPVWILALLMVLVGLAGPTVTPPQTAVLLVHVPARWAGTASGAFNISRQVGGAVSVAVFGVLLADSETFMRGLRTSLLLAAGVTLVTALVSLRHNR
jgi:MFS transporter, DHA2 family, methylenomycin A resistance protein